MIRRNTPLWEVGTQHILTDGWFRMIEFSIVLGGLHYFMNKTQSMMISIVYWLSWFMLFAWFVQLGQYFAHRVSTKKPKRTQFLIYTVVVLFFILTFLIVTNIGNAITTSK